MYDVSVSVIDRTYSGCIELVVSTTTKKWSGMAVPTTVGAALSAEGLLPEMETVPWEVGRIYPVSSAANCVAHSHAPAPSCVERDVFMSRP